MASCDTRLALVTGATGGIGRAVSLALARSGYSLALHWHAASEQTRNELLSQVKTLQASSGHADASARLFQADLGSVAGARELWTAITQATWGVSPGIVVLNAGTTGGVVLGPDGGGGIAEVVPEAFERTWRVNTLAPFELARLAVPAMQRGGRGGRVIFVSSVAALSGGVVGPHYASSKAALHGLVHWLAASVAKEGITVNAVAPALVQDTGMLPGAPEELKSKIPVGRLGRPEEVASTVMWMVENGYVTNKVIAVDGGMVAR